MKFDLRLLFALHGDGSKWPSNIPVNLLHLTLELSCLGAGYHGKASTNAWPCGRVIFLVAVLIIHHTGVAHSKVNALASSLSYCTLSACCLSASVYPDLFIRTCLSASVYPHLFIRICSSATVHPHLFIRICLSAPVYPHLFLSVALMALSVDRSDTLCNHTTNFSSKVSYTNR